MMVPVPPADGRSGIIAGREPRLGEISLLEIIRRSRAAHLRGNPARVDRIAQNVGPAPRDREGEHSHIELAVRVGLARVPASLIPIDVSQRSDASPMHAATEVHQSPWALDQSRQHVWSESVDGNNGGVTVFRW